MNPAKVKATARDRDGYVCTECGMTNDEHRQRFGRSLDVHRVKPGSRYTLAGSRTLCRPCHRRLHSGDLSPTRMRGSRKDGRQPIQLLVPVEDLKLLRAAAGIEGVSVQQFLLRVALAESEKILLNSACLS